MLVTSETGCDKPNNEDMPYNHSIPGQMSERRLKSIEAAAALTPEGGKGLDIRLLELAMGGERLSFRHPEIAAAGRKLEAAEWQPGPRASELKCAPGIGIAKIW